VTDLSNVSCLISWAQAPWVHDYSWQSSKWNIQSFPACYGPGVGPVSSGAVNSHTRRPWHRRTRKAWREGAVSDYFLNALLLRNTYKSNTAVLQLFNILFIYLLHGGKNNMKYLTRLQPRMRLRTGPKVLVLVLVLVLLWTSVGWAFTVHIRWPSSEHRGGSWRC